METTWKPSLRAPSTPGGALAIAAVASILAGILIFSALHANKKTAAPAAPTAPARVLVANRTIAKGSPAAAIVSDRSTHLASVAQNALVGGAVTDFAQINGKVATHDILRGQQLTAADFTTRNATALTARITGDQRAVSVPIDASHGLIGDAKAGDHVDVFASFGTNSDGAPSKITSVLKPLATDVLVLKSPDKAKGGVSGSGQASVMTLRLPSRTAAKLAFTADNGKVWVVLRPPTGAPKVDETMVTIADVLGGTVYEIRPNTGAANTGAASAGAANAKGQGK